MITELGFDHDKLLVGFTATPERQGRQQLGDIFEKIVFMRSIATMIDFGYLCPVVGRKILTTTSLDGIRTKMGDFEQSQLADRVATYERNNFIAQKYLQHAKNRKGIAFCANVRHAKSLADCLCKHGVKAAAIWGAMPHDDRKKILKDLAKGKLQVVTPVGVLTEGFDETSLEVVLMCTPTKSPVKYIQCIGRVLRLHPGKTSTLVLDYTDTGHNLDAVMDNCIEDFYRCIDFCIFLEMGRSPSLKLHHHSKDHGFQS